MITVSACQIFNESDKTNYTLYVEWLGPYFKVMVLKSALSPLIGEMSTEEIKYFSDELSKSSDKYLQETKEAFCGKNKEIQFCIQDKTFEWKTNVWTLGRIMLHPISNIDVISESLQHLLHCHQSIQEKLEILERENAYLKEIKTKLSIDIEEMTKMKNTMEQDLYKKFLLILNSKKKKIQELQNASGVRNSLKDPIFNTDTDESSEEESMEKSNIQSKSPKTEKRKPKDKYDFDRYICKTRKTDFDITSNSDINDNMHCEASTSKNFVSIPSDTLSNHPACNNENKHKMQQNSSHKATKSRSLLNFIEEQSEDELFSQSQ